MPLTAIHATLGELDATLDNLGQDGATWESVHRVRPRAPLACRGCGRRVHAKVSPSGLRFFAHDSGADCPSAGETLAHRLLKVELVTAVRAAGWHGELEVAGEGWRADVMATSPDGGRRMAWEAQLSPITVEDIRQRTECMTASGLRVCWVADRKKLWLGHVPSIQVAQGEDGTGLMVTDGPRKFYIHEPIVSLGRPRTWGSWNGTEPVPLTRFVSAVLAGTVFPYRFGVRLGWTTSRYLEMEVQHEAKQRKAREQADREAGEIRRRQAEIRALRQRQQGLAALVHDALCQDTQSTKHGHMCSVHIGEPDPLFGMGARVQASGRFPRVLCPRPHYIVAGVRKRLLPLTVFVESEDERRQLERVCLPGQRFEVLD